MSSPGHAILSGASSGIGLALARRLAAKRWDLTILARDPARLFEAEADLRACGSSRVRTVSVDVTDREQVDREVALAITSLGPPRLVIAAAGMVATGRFAALAPEAFRDCIEVNYFGSLHLVQAVLPSMRTQRGGQIVLIASGAALLGLYGYTAYAPSKFAVRGLAEALRSEFAPEGIRVAVAFPPDTDTSSLREEIRQRPEVTSRIAGKARVRSAEMVADAILRAVARRRFGITPGWEMTGLLALHSLVGPLLQRFWFDRIIARFHRLNYFS